MSLHTKVEILEAIKQVDARIETYNSAPLFVFTPDKLEAFAHVMKSEALEEAAQILDDLYGEHDIAKALRQRAKEMR